MDDRIVDPNRGVRRILYGLGASILLAIPFVVYLEKNVIVLMVGILVLLGCSGAILVMSAVTYPYVILHADGVLVRFLFQKKLYRWDEIAQAGRYWNNRKSPAMQFFSLVLICASGSPKRAGKDRTFLARNFMKAIALPNEREIRLFITETYGPLDFDDYKGISSWEKKLYELDKT